MSRAGLYLSPFSLGGERRYAVTGVIWKASLAILTAALLLGGCASPGDDPAATTYDRIYVQSVEVDGIGFLTMEISLYGSAPAGVGDTLDATGQVYAPNVDYTANASAGAVFYIRVTAAYAAPNEAYAIRVLALAAGAAAATLAPLPDTGFPDPFEEANDSILPWSGGDAHPVTLDVPVVRYLEPSNTDVDWFKLTLP